VRAEGRRRRARTTPKGAPPRTARGGRRRAPTPSAIAAGMSVLLAVVVATGCGGETAPGSAVVAEVDGMPIRQAVVERWALVNAANEQATASLPRGSRRYPVRRCVVGGKATDLGGQHSKSPRTLGCLPVSEGLERAAFGDLVRASWIAAEAHARRLRVPRGMLDSEFLRIRKRQFPVEGSFTEYLRRTGQTEADLRERVRISLLLQAIDRRIEGSVSPPSERAMAAYYAENRTSYVGPGSRYVDFLQEATRSAASGARTKLTRGGTAPASSAIRPAGLSARLPRTYERQLRVGDAPEVLTVAAFTAPIDRWEGPIQTPQGFYVFEVRKVVRGQLETFAQAARRVREQLLAGEQQRALAAFNSSFSARWRAHTRCAAAWHSDEYCSGTL
jgi:hypothetical protein